MREAAKAGDDGAVLARRAQIAAAGRGCGEERNAALLIGKRF